MVSAEFIINSAKKASHKTLITIVAGYHLVYFSKRTSGTVYLKQTSSGKVK